MIRGEGKVGRVEVDGTSCLGGCCWETTEGVAIGVHMEPISDTVVDNVGWDEEAMRVCVCVCVCVCVVKI